MLGELETNSRSVICDLEAGLGTLGRLKAGNADVVLVVAEPSAKSIEAARRASIIAHQHSRVIVVANRVQDEADVEAIRRILGEHEFAIVPEDPLITRSDREGVAPIDAHPDSPAVTAITKLAHRLVGIPEGEAGATKPSLATA